MSVKDFGIIQAELLLERKENKPQAGEVCTATVLVKNSRGLYVDINKTYEAYIPAQELGSVDYNVGDRIEACVVGTEANQDGIYKLSLKEIENSKNWHKLEELQGQSLDLLITRLVKSGVEVEIIATKQTAFVPFRYIDSHYGPLAGLDQNDWVGRHISGRIQELDRSKNKIILNNRVISEEQKIAHTEEVMRSLAIGQEVHGKIVRLADFGVFVDVGGVDALVPASELSWRRFKKPSDIVKVGDELTAKVFRVDTENKKIGLSVKQAQLDPWTVLPEFIQIGARVSGPIVTRADFGVFVEILPGVEALLHKSNFNEGAEFPEIGTRLEAEISNLNASQRRMGIKLLHITPDQTEEKELEHV